ncbi:MAG TPA: Ig-like domain-containing protein [Treponemataceae bacterium]|nr:Ig-like domain-containing protein [Treponemataceae bacterium]
MKKTRMIRSSIIALAVSAMLFTTACEQPTDTTVIDKTNIVNTSPNKVTASVSGVLLDGYGNPIDGVNISYSNGADGNGRSARAIASTNSDGNGRFELQFLNESSEGEYTVTLKKNGYASRLIYVTVPTIKTIRTEYGDKLKEVSSLTITSADGTTAVESTGADGFHYNIGLGTQYMYELGATVTGTFLVKKDATDGSADAVPPAAGSLVTFTLGKNYLPHFITAETDATGAFEFSTENGNPLPVFLSDSPWSTTASFSIQPQGDTFSKWSDGSGFLLYSTVASKLATRRAADGDTDLGTLYAIGEVRASIDSFSPKTFDSNGVTTRMASDANIVVVFDQAMNTAAVSAKDVSFTSEALGVDYSDMDAVLTWSTDNTTLTINPGEDFAKGDAVSIAFSNAFVSADGNNLYVPADPVFYIEEGIELRYTSWDDASENVSKVAVTDSVALTFNIAIEEIDTKETYLFNVTDLVKVPAEITFAGAVLTVNPAHELKNGTTYLVSYKVRSGVNDSDWINGGVSFDTETNDAIVLIGSNVLTAKLEETRADIAVDSNITLTFDANVAATIANGTEYTVELSENVSGDVVDAVVSIAGAVVTINPVESLKFDMKYDVDFTLWNGLGGAADTSDTLSFTTVKGPALTTPVVQADVTYKKIYNSGDSDYDNGNTEFYIVVVADANTDGFDVEYRYSDETIWQAAGSNITSWTGTNAYLEVTGATLTSGTGVQIRVVSTSTKGYLDSAVSNVVTFTDTQAAAVTDVYINATSLASLVTGSTYNIGLGNNGSDTFDVYHAYNIGIGAAGGKEKIGVLTPTVAGLSGVTWLMTYNTDHTLATLHIFVTKTADVATPTNPAGTMTIRISDAAGNVVDVNPATTVVDSLTLTL